MPDAYENVLLVEDGDHLYVVSSLMQKKSFYTPRSKTQSLEIKRLGTVTKVLDFDYVLVEWQNPNLKRLGIIVDADNSAVRRRESIKKITDRLGIQWTYSEPGPVSLQHADGKKFGAWIMPNNLSPGMIETFCMQMVDRSNDPVWKYAGQAMMRARRKGARWKDTHRHRSNLYTWLAWQHKPGAPMGLAIEKGLLANFNDNSDDFVDWFCTLFEIEKK